ncbi:MAG: hypothetical protein IKY68_03020 [Alistipes sp.]|nr:hypothetical protein [Alistipes sp.]
MRKVYRYRIDRRTWYWTLLYVAVYIGLGAVLYLLYEGGYFSAWFATSIGALLILMALSIPRRLIVSDQLLEVRCLLDATELDREEIASVRKLEAEELRFVLPLYGGCGFFGYYGHFLDLKHFERVKIYASEWRNMVEITTIYEDKLWLSCSEADELVNLLTEE